MPQTTTQINLPTESAGDAVAGAVTGVQLMQGLGVAPAKGFWADAWSRVLTRRGAVAAMCWIGVVVFFAVFAPFLASGHPAVLHDLDARGDVVRTTYPLLRFLKASDILLVEGSLAVVAVLALARGRHRAPTLGYLCFGAVVAGFVVVLTSLVEAYLPESWPGIARSLRRWQDWQSGAVVGLVVGAVVGAVAVALPVSRSVWGRGGVCLVALTGAVVSVSLTWNRPLEVFNYTARETAGEVRAVYTLVPFSPSQRFSELNRRPPGAQLGPELGLPPGAPAAGRTFHIGSDAYGQDALSQILHACRLSISIGLVSTGIAVLIGVTMGALMGYFGGWMDLCLYRVVEIFMAIPVLFLLIVAAGVLPPEMRSTYVTMAIIGAFTWTGAARFTRAEFLKLRNQDFVQGAKACGLPLRSILFRHMLPNGVTPVLVDASFAIAAAILAEAILSFLGLGPVDSPSWGKLLSNATSAEGEFKWWLAVFPGMAIFLTVLSYNLIGEALRDAIDPKLKKARV